MSSVTNIKTIIFDVDGTLTDSISWTTLTSLLGADDNIHKQIFEQYKNNTLSYEEAKLQLIKLWTSTGKATVTGFDNAFDKIPLRHGVTNVIRELKEKYQICLISGSMDRFVANIASRLDIDDYYYNTNLIFDTSGKLSDFDYTFDQSEKKLQQFRQYSRKYGLSPSECAVVGDGNNDANLLDYLGLPILFLNENTPPELLEKVKIKITDLNHLLNIL
jgi:HAD superfamily phosphoserine phosphatase-like hydrolase